MDIITTVIAAYGAALSTVVAIFEFFKYINDRPRIKVSWEPQNVKKNSDGSVCFLSISFKAINQGKRPVVLSGAWLELEPGYANLPKLGFPRKLHEAEAHHIYVTIDSLIKKIAGRKIKYVAFGDQTGRIYKTRKDLDSLKSFLGQAT